MSLIFSGCAKDLLDQNLNYNPFDPEYVGESPFELISATPFLDLDQETGQLVQMIAVDFIVDESTFTSQQPFYYVRIEDELGEQSERISSLNTVGSVFQYEYEHIHESACIYLYLESGLSTSSRFSLCFNL